MNDSKYPSGVDCVWLASDRDRNLGAFVTGGSGPIPLRVLNGELVRIEDIEGRMFDLPSVSNSRLLVSMKKADDFIALAERGFFVYDWRDVHRTLKDSTFSYELIAIPLNPTRVDALPDPLLGLARDVIFNNTRFANQLALDVRNQFECIES